MIADLKPYPEYKESGLPWLGQVPRHWSLVLNRGLVRRKKVLVGERHGEYQLLSLTKQGVIVRDISTGKGKFSIDMGTSQEVHNGDLVFCLFDVPETPRTVGLSRHDGMITGAYTVFESLGKGSSEYFELFYRAMDDRKLLSPLYSGLRHTIPVERFLGTKTPQPPPQEQEAVVRFLNWANGRLERAIRAKRKVIALLEEQKRAIIHRAVTCGLDPNVRLKPSGVTWLGEIPATWETWQLGHFCRIGNGSTPSRSNSAYWSGGRYPWLNSSHANSDRVTEADQFVTDAALRECHLPVVSPGSVLVAITGQGKTRGKATVLCIEATINQHLAFLRPRIDICSPTFLQAVLVGAYPFLRATSDDSGSTRGALTCTGLSHFKVALPPTDEQERIFTTIGSQTRSIDDSIQKAIRETELIHEYRGRLVSEVVTGKLDVRAAVNQLPMETQELVPQERVDETAEQDQESGETEFVDATGEAEA